jgi:hypothetical protein
MASLPLREAVVLIDRSDMSEGLYIGQTPVFDAAQIGNKLRKRFDAVVISPQTRLRIFRRAGHSREKLFIDRCAILQIGTSAR